MKNVKRIASLVLALIMAFAMVNTSMAATTTATITNATEGHSYKAYQVFSGTQGESEGVLGNLGWGNGINVSTLLNALSSAGFNVTAQSTANEVAALLDDTNAAQFAKIAVQNLTSDFTSIAADATSVEIETGYYLLVDDTDVSGKHDAHNPALLEVIKDINITVKYNVPTVEKKIEGGDTADVTNVSIGDAVKFELTGTLASNYADYETYKYVFHDTLSKGLTYNNDAAVYVVNGDAEFKLSSGFTISSREIDEGEEVGQTTLTISCDNLKTLSGVTIDKDSKIIVKYTATLNDEAVINGSNPNTVYLEYSNNPNFDADTDNDGSPDKTPPTGNTPEDKVEVYTTDVEILKKDNKNTILTGAAFRITGTKANVVVTTGDVFVQDNTNGTYYKLKDGTYTTVVPSSNIDTSDYESTTVMYSRTTTASLTTKGDAPVKAEGFVDQTGKLNFAGLGVGEYTITEIVTPGGYNTIGEIELTIAFDPQTKTFSYTWSGAVSGNGSDMTVINQSGIELPETGGIGTTLFYVIGGVLVVAAVVLLVTRKRMKSME